MIHNLFQITSQRFSVFASRWSLPLMEFETPNSGLKTFVQTWTLWFFHIWTLFSYLSTVIFFHPSSQRNMTPNFTLKQLYSFLTKKIIKVNSTQVQKIDSDFTYSIQQLFFVVSFIVRVFSLSSVLKYLIGCSLESWAFVARLNKFQCC